MKLIKKKHFLNKSFYCLGKSLDTCYLCKYCRTLDNETKGLDIITLPSEINPLFNNIPIAINIFYGDPLLQIGNTIQLLYKLEKAQHKGPIIIITKGDFTQFPDIDFDLDLHFAFSTFGKDDPLDGSTYQRFLNNLDEAIRKGKYKYSIEFRPIIYSVNDDWQTIDRVMKTAEKYGFPVGFSGIQGKPSIVEYWKNENINIQPFPNSEFGFKKFLPSEIEKLIFSYNIPSFKKTSCLISYVHGFERDYNAHYYRPNELGCNQCIMNDKCMAFYKNIDKDLKVDIPFDYEVIYKEQHTCNYNKICKFSSEDCKNLKGYFIKIEKEISTSDVRIIKWLTGLTVDANFVELPYISHEWSLEEDEAIVTDHAYLRIKQRANIKGKKVQKLAQKALDNGIHRREISGGLRRFLDKEFFSFERRANNLRIFQYKVFIFRDDLLITAFDLPKIYRKTIENIYRKKKNDK